MALCATHPGRLQQPSFDVRVYRSLQNSGVKLGGVLASTLVAGVVLFVLAAVARRHRHFGNRFRFIGMGMGCLVVIATLWGLAIAAYGGGLGTCIVHC